VFVTTHNMDEAEYCQRVGIMKLGRLVEVENPQALKQRHEAASMQEVFLKIVRGEGR
jgi:ABC-2 type transport system ATP-binding protein